MGAKIFALTSNQRSRTPPSGLWVTTSLHTHTHTHVSQYFNLWLGEGSGVGGGLVQYDVRCGFRGLLMVFNSERTRLRR